jgi:HTH-type transcriptional regulator / antitoxin HigA
MTLTFNPESYTDLLVRHQPKPLKTDFDYEATIDLANELEHQPQLTQAEELLLELLITLIEKYEATHEPIPHSSGTSVLHHLMAAQEINANDLVSILGSLSIVEQILTGQQAINITQAQSLAKRLNVTAQVFL